jgi:[1-hydroxy-2-(trimethylamino)ethyl]phosphonate dioxygenase
MSIIDQIISLFRQRGDAMYGGEAVTQTEHALQTAHLAERSGSPSTLIAAALLHDFGHLVHDLPEDAADLGMDDAHEALGARWLADHFGLSVTEPGRLHVAAKRYLCAVDEDYLARLSPASVQSLALQGGPMSDAEIRAFEKLPFAADAVKLRRWDDQAKIPGLEVPGLAHYRHHLDSTRSGAPSS